MNLHNDKSLVAVTETEFKKGKTVFEMAENTHGLCCFSAPEPEDKLAETVKQNGAAHVIVGIEKYEKTLYQALPQGGVIARFGVGYDGIDLEAATEKSIFCTNTPGVLNESVAEHTIGLMLDLARHTSQLHKKTIEGAWSPRIGMELKGKNLAIIGCGPIGCTVAEIASRGFGMNVTGCEIRDVAVEEMKNRYGFTDITKEFSKACDNADFVSIHLPSTPATQHFINADRLAQVPQKANIINTARGAVLDETVLFSALSTGKLAGAALDVFENEPYQPADKNHDLRTLDNVILTPHIGSSTKDACRRMAEQCLDNIKSAEQNQYKKMNLLNTKTGKQHYEN